MQVQAHRVKKKLVQARAGGLIAQVIQALRGVQVPVALNMHLALAQHEPVRGRQLPDVGKERLGGVIQVAVDQVIGQAFIVDAARRGGVGKQRLDFGGKDEALAVGVIVERLDAEAVARGKELLAALIPKGKGKHAVEMLHAILAPLFVGVQNGFGVAA